MAIDGDKLAQVEIITRVAAASDTPTWKTLYDITTGVSMNRPNKTTVKPIQGEDYAAAYYIGGDEAMLSFGINPYKTGTRREGFSVIQAAQAGRDIVLVQVFLGPVANGTIYHQHAFIVPKCDFKADLGDTEAYDIELLRTIYAGFSDVRNGTYAA
jgi:hypothetical protein